MSDPPLRYRELAPLPALLPYVECLWLLEGATGNDCTTHPVLPDGCAELIIHLGDPFEATLDDGPPRLQSRAHFVGQLERRLLLRPSRRVAVLGVRFRPAGAAALLREPQARLTGGWVELEALIGQLGRELVEIAGDAPSLEAAALRVARRLLPALTLVHDQRIAAAANRLVATRGGLRIDALAREVGLSTRQLERGFLRDVGVTPKFLAKVLRFQRVFHAVERRPERWARVAADCGYYDASHLIRDFRALAGEAPARLVESAGELTRWFTRGGRGRETDLSNTAA